MKQSRGGERAVGTGVKVLQIAFYKFCVRLKSVTEQHMDKLKKRLPTRARFTSASLGLRTTPQNSMLDRQGQAAGGRERCGNRKATEEHVKRPGMITVYEA